MVILFHKAYTSCYSTYNHYWLSYWEVLSNFKVLSSFKAAQQILQTLYKVSGTLYHHKQKESLGISDERCYRLLGQCEFCFMSALWKEQKWRQWRLWSKYRTPQRNSRYCYSFFFIWSISKIFCNQIILKVTQKPRVRQIPYAKCKCTATDLLCMPSLWKPCKGLYADIMYLYFLTSSLTLLSSLVENYFVLLFISIFWPECLDDV